MPAVAIHNDDLRGRVTCRRAQTTPAWADTATPQTVRQLTIPAEGAVITAAGRTVTLSDAQIRLLRILAADPARLYTYSEIYDLGMDITDGRIDAAANGLRMKLLYSGVPALVHRIQALGYQLLPTQT